MKILIDDDLCEGNAVCMKVAPTVFHVGEDDRATILLDTIPEEMRPQVEVAVRRCPRQALTLVD